MALLRADCEMVQLVVKNADGTQQTFDYFASSLEIEEAECRAKAATALPSYLDDIDFDSRQCVATKEQLEREQKSGGGWLSALKFW